MIQYPDQPSRQFIPVLAAAFLGAIAAVVPAIVLTLNRIEEPWNIVVVSEGLVLAELTYVVALAHALVLGLPGFFLLRSKGRVGIVSCGCAGFLIGAGPFGALGFLSMLGMQNASSGGKQTVVNHVPTLAGWIEYASAVGFAGLLGLVGGVTFGGVIRWCGVRSQAANRDQGVPRTLPWRSPIVCSLAILLTGAVFGLPHFVRDTSCHNLFRDGRTSIGPQLGADMNLTTDDWTRLRQIFIEFGRANGLAFRGDEQIRDGRLMWRTLGLCNEAGVTIVVTDKPWLTDIHSPLANRGMELDIFELKQGSNWQPLAHDLLDKLEVRWSGRLTYHGPRGSAIPREEALKGRQ